MARKRRIPHVPKLPVVSRLLAANPPGGRHRPGGGRTPAMPPPPRRATPPSEPRRSAREEIARRPSTARLSGSDTPARRGGAETGRGRVIPNTYGGSLDAQLARERARPTKSTRQQLADRPKNRMGQPHHDERAALLARSSSYDKRGRATGRAARPASRLPTADPEKGVNPVERGRRHPPLSGRTFANQTPGNVNPPTFADRFFK